MTRRWVTGVWILAAWTGLALFMGISSSLAYISVGNPPRWSLTIRMALAETYVWALITPFVMAVARRFPFTRATVWSSIGVHLFANLIVGFAKLVIDQAVRQVLFGFSGYVLLTSLAPNFLFYWGIVAVTHGLAYYGSSKEKELKASQLEVRLAQARLQLLQMQLHPHFLFNTLHTISELVHEDPEAADRMITGLSELLREALVAGNAREVPLRRELELLDLYLDIQQARFGDRLRIEVGVDPSVAEALVPHLSLQPVVENAIRHGIGAHAGTGHIQIEARQDRAANMLILQVRDDGQGLAEAGAGLREGIGLGNTRARLQELYGPAHRVDIQDAPGGGAIVTLAIPLRFAKAATGPAQ
jgi:two-component system, LytTR family, sensor kinase